MSSSYIPKDSSGGLPIPKVRLSTIGYSVDIDIFDDVNNTTLTQAKLFRYPEVVAMDLTTEQIEKGVYLEMVIYKNGKSRTSTIGQDSAYKIPVSWIGGVNLFNGKPTRGGSHSHKLTGSLVAVDRPNHYKINAHNEVINAWQYLHNRFVVRDVQWRDTIGNINGTDMIIPAWRKNKFRSFAKTFMYSSEYSPMYIAFRYIMENEDGLRFHSGGLSRVVKICHDVHPFLVDGVESAILDATCGTINPLFNINSLQCSFETRLP